MADGDGEFDDSENFEQNDSEPNLAPLPKPHELLALNSITEELFDTLKLWFRVGPTITLNVEAVDSAVTELGEPVLVAAMAMRKLQALNLLSVPGVLTTTDVVIAIVQDLDRALLQAPEMYLNLAAQRTDWDTAFEEAFTPVANDATDVGFDHEIAEDADEADPEIEHFRMMHGELHNAMYAVLEASDGEIRFFE